MDQTADILQAQGQRKEALRMVQEDLLPPFEQRWAKREIAFSEQKIPSIEADLRSLPRANPRRPKSV